MSARADARSRLLAELGDALAGAGVPALVLSEPPEVPHVELLLPRGTARAAQRALAPLGWRRRVGGDGAWRLARRRRYVFDGGFVVTVHHALPTGPLPALALRPLGQALWAGAERRGDDGLLRAGGAAKVVYLSVQAARGALRSTAQRAELDAEARGLGDRHAAHSLARTAGVEAQVRDVLGARVPAGRAGVPPAAWRAARALRARTQRWAIGEALIGEPWRSAVTRCRFDGVELLVGPGTFLPRAVSEQLVRAACARPFGGERPVAVDVGTGCGAIALALARRNPLARVIGVDLDERALKWARRNRRRLGLSQVGFASGSLLDPVPAELRARVSLMTANVPCVPEHAFEGGLDAGAHAYVGVGADGLGLQRTLADEARGVLEPGGRLLVQLAPSQWPAYRETLHRLGYDALDASGGSVAVVATGRWPGTRLPR